MVFIKSQNTLLKILLYFLSLMFLSGNCFSQTGQNDLSWHELYDSTKTYFDSGDYESALKFAMKAASMTEEKFDEADSNYCKNLKIIYEIYYNLWDTDQSITWAGKYSKAAKSCYGKFTKEYISSVNDLAYLYQLKKDFSKADSIYQISLELNEEFYGGDNPEYARTLNDIALFYRSINDLQQARKLFESSLQMLRRLYPEGHKDIAISAVNLAAFYKNQGQIERADTLYREAVNVAAEVFEKNDITYANIINNAAVFFDSHGKFGEAENLFSRALNIYREIYKRDNPDLAAGILNNAGFYARQNKKTMAEALYHEALEMYRRIYKGDHKDLAMCLNNIGAFYDGLGETDNAEKYYSQSLAMSQRLYNGPDPALATSISNMAYFYYSRGRYTEAEGLFREALEMRRKLYTTDHPDLANSINNMAAFYESIGKLREAESLYRESLEMRRRIFTSDHPGIALSMNNLAAFYESAGRYDEAGKLLEESLAMRRRLFNEDRPELATSINNMGAFYLARGKNEEAGKLFIEALRMRQRLFKDNNPGLAVSYNNMAHYYYESGKYNEAENMFIKALEIRKEIYPGDHPDLALSFKNLANFYRNRKELQKAEKYYETAVAIFRRIYKCGNSDMAACLVDYAHYKEMTGDFNTSHDLFLEGLGIYRNIFNSNSVSFSEKERSAFLSTFKSAFEGFNSFAVKYQDKSAAREIYNKQLFLKGILLSSTKKIKDRILNSGDSSMVNLFINWQQLRGKIAKSYSMTKSELIDNGLNTDSLENAANKIEKKLALQSEDFKRKFERKNYSYDDVRDALKDGEAAVEIIRFISFENDRKKISYAALIAASALKNPKLIVFDNGSEMESGFTSYYKKSIKYRLEDIESYKHYWKPIADKLKELNVRKVWLAPDGIYHKISIGSLFNPKSGKFAIDEFEIVNIGSTRDILEVSNSAATAKTALLVGNPQYYIDKSFYQARSEGSNVYLASSDRMDDPQNSGELIRSPANYTGTFIPALPGTGKEIELISEILEKNGYLTKELVNENAAESSIKNSVNPGILHIATHGLFREDAENRQQTFGIQNDKFIKNPLLRSMLLLAGAGNTLQSDTTESLLADHLFEDGLLTAYEVQNLNLDNTELVVLSACETGLGEIRNGEGVYGLQRAFKVAGAESLIMSLWNVSDKATQELMDTFYENWLSGQSKREAFRNAQMELREKYVHPYYWGAFVMVGG